MVKKSWFWEKIELFFETILVAIIMPHQGWYMNCSIQLNPIVHRVHFFLFFNVFNSYKFFKLNVIFEMLFIKIVIGPNLVGVKFSKKLFPNVFWKMKRVHTNQLRTTFNTSLYANGMIASFLHQPPTTTRFMWSFNIV